MVLLNYSINTRYVHCSAYGIINLRITQVGLAITGVMAHSNACNVCIWRAVVIETTLSIMGVCTRCLVSEYVATRTDPAD